MAGPALDFTALDTLAEDLARPAPALDFGALDTLAADLVRPAPAELGLFPERVPEGTPPAAAPMPVEPELRAERPGGMPAQQELFPPWGAELPLGEQITGAIRRGITGSLPGAAIGAATTALTGIPPPEAPPAGGLAATVVESATRLGIDALSAYAPIERGVASLLNQAVRNYVARGIGAEEASRLVFGPLLSAARTAAARGTAFGVTDAARAALQASAQGTDLGTAAGEAVTAGLRGGAVGAVTGVATELVPPPVLQALAEAGALGTVPALTEGRLPTVNELLTAGVQVGVLRGAYALAGVPWRGPRVEVVPPGTAEAVGARPVAGRPVPAPPPTPEAPGPPAPVEPTPPAPAAPPPTATPPVAAPVVPAPAPMGAPGPAVAVPPPAATPPVAAPTGPPSMADLDAIAGQIATESAPRAEPPAPAEVPAAPVASPAGAETAPPLAPEPVAQGETAAPVPEAILAPPAVPTEAMPPAPAAPAPRPIRGRPAAAPPITAFAPPPPGPPAEGGTGYTRVGIVPPGVTLPPGGAAGYHPNGLPGRIVGEDPEHVYVTRSAGAATAVHQYRRAEWDAAQAYWTPGHPVDTPEGPAQLLSGPRWGNQGHQMVTVQLPGQPPRETTAAWLITPFQADRAERLARARARAEAAAAPPAPAETLPPPAPPPEVPLAAEAAAPAPATETAPPPPVTIEPYTARPRRALPKHLLTDLPLMAGEVNGQPMWTNSRVLEVGMSPAATEQPLPPKLVTFLRDIARRATATVRPIGASERLHGPKSPEIVWFSTGAPIAGAKGQFLPIDRIYADYLLARHPAATLAWGGGARDPLVLREGKQIVGLIAPLGVRPEDQDALAPRLLELAHGQASMPAPAAAPPTPGRRLRGRPAPTAPAPPRPAAPSAPAAPAPAAPTPATGMGRPGSRYEGDRLTDLLPATQAEQTTRLGVIRMYQDALAAGRTVLGRPLSDQQAAQYRDELASLRSQYEGAYSEVADAAGPDAAETMRRAVEGAEAPAPTPAPEPGVPVYEHAARFADLERAFTRAIAENRLPKDARELRKLAADAMGLTEKALRSDAAALDDLYDALEVAVNKQHRIARAMAADTSLAGRVALAQKAEAYLGNRTRTLELSKLQQFSTPLPLAEAAAYALDARPGETVFEPTAGTGNLLAAVDAPVVAQAVELDPRRVQALLMQGYPAIQGDALRTPMAASHALMNPPWGKYTAKKYGPSIPMPYGRSVDVAERFVVKALRELPDGGRLAAIMPTTILRSPEFLTWLRTEHTLRALIESPPGAYTTRGTGVESVLLVVDKGRIPDAPDALRATPATWAEYATAVEPLAAGGTHARPAATRAVPVRRSTDPGPGPAPGEARPEGVAPGPAEGGAPESVAPAPIPAPRRAPGRRRGAEAGVPGVGGGPGPGPGAEPGAGVVAGAGGGREPVEPGGAGPQLQREPGRPPEPLVLPSGQRFSVADPADLEAVARSQVFAATPLRSAPGLNPHPRLVVKTRSLAGAALPPLTYQPQGRLLPDAYARQVISDAQWDYGIIPALQANANGHGFLVAADVGVGKTRVAAAVAGEWLEAGARRVLYVTASEVNIQDVKREFDLYAGGTFPFELLEVKAFKGAKEKAQGEPEPLPDEQGVYLVDRYNFAKFSTALRRLGFDGLIGDEAHLLRNIEGSTVGKAWFALQRELLTQRAKFVYLTATPATDFDDLEHFVGLREWTPDGFTDYKLRVTGQAPEAQAPETPQERAAEQARLERQLEGLFGVGGPETFYEWKAAHLKETPAFATSVERREIDEGNLEALRQAILERGGAPGVGSDAEALGVTKKGGRAFLRGPDVFGTFITPAEQEQVMRELAMKGKYDSVDLWRAGVEFTVETQGLTEEQRTEYAALTRFFAKVNDGFLKFGKLNAVRRFVNIRTFLQQEAKRRLFDYRIDHALELARAALARGEQPVISTITVHGGSEDQGPMVAAINTINAKLIETNEAGEVTLEEDIPEALALRAELLDEWRAFRQVRNPTELIEGALGQNRVAIITGDTPAKTREKLIQDFQEGRLPAALISDAGKTGISLHHVVETATGAKGRRHLIVADYDWSATTFKQLLGRVDRSGQVSAPKVTVLSSGAAAERKFVATIANRMRNLGALSKGSAESASNDKLAEFEIGGTLDTHAMRLAYRALPREIQEAFLGSAWKEQVRDATGQAPPVFEHTRGYPQKADLKTFLLDLQFMPVEFADEAFETFWRERAAQIAKQTEVEEARAARTRVNRGTLLRTTPLRDTLLLHEVKDEHGHHFGILQGLVTDYMGLIARHLPKNPAGVPIRAYLTFQAAGQQIAGLEVRAGAITSLARTFGKSLQRELKTPEAVVEALRAGDRVPLQGAAGYTLRMRPSDQRIAVEGAKMADKAELLRHGAAYVPAGNFWTVSVDKLPGFLERYPVRQRVAPAETADAVTARHLAEVREQHREAGEAGAIRLGRLLPGGGGRVPPPTPPGAPPAGPAAPEPEPEPPRLTAENPDVEAVLTATAARGPRGLLRWMREAVEAAQRAVTFEPDLVGFPLERDEVRTFQAAKRQTRVKAQEDVIGVVGRLRDDPALEQLARLVVLRDLRSRASMPERFPGGVPGALTLDEIEPELARLEAAASPSLQEALAAHDALMAAERADLEARELLDPEREIPYYFPHHVLDFERPGGPAPGPRRIQTPSRPFLRRAQGSPRLIEAKDYIRAMFRHRATVRWANAVDDFALTILDRHDRVSRLPQAVRAELRPGQHVELDGQDYQVFQYKPGRAIFPAVTVPERVLAEAIAQGTGKIDIAELRRAAGLGRWHRLYVVPAAIAKRFETWAAPENEQGLRLLNDATSRWKGLTIGFWGQAGNLMNLQGDLMNLLRQEPAAAGQLVRAVREVIAWQRGSGSEVMRRLEQYDVIQSGYVGTEADTFWRSRVPELRQFLSRAERLRADARGLLRFYFHTIPEAREAIPRVAIALAELRRVERGRPLRGRGIDIAGLPPERAAMKIAREMSVDYPRFTPFENRLLRGFLLPFYAWTAGNTPNWIRYAIAAPMGMAVFLGFRLLLELWNNRDAESRTVERGLSDYARNAAHVVTGWHDAQGKAIVIRWAGDPLADALGTIGLGGTIPRLSDLATEQVTLSRSTRAQLEALVKEPGGRLVDLFTPLIKVPIQLAANRETFGRGRDIVPPYIHGAERLGRQGRYLVESLVRPLREYRSITEQMGRPGGGDWLTARFGLGLPLTRVDPQGAAAYQANDRYYAASDEAVERAQAAFQDSPEASKMSAKEREVMLREIDARVRRAFARLAGGPPVSPRALRLRRAAE